MLPEKFKTAMWFLKRPDHYAFALALAARKARPSLDTPELRSRAREWAAERATSVRRALEGVGLLTEGTDMPALPPGLIEEGMERAKRSAVQMGGPGDLDLLCAAVALSGATRVVETGVAYGWSSLAILAALAGRPGARLVSVDMPYPKMGNEDFVGIAVPERLRGPWELIREPDRNGLKKALARLGGTVDLCHYDSDKSYWGRQYAYPLLWSSLAPGGTFISDDIQDNMAFADFIKARNVPYFVTEYQGKFVGIARKPAR